MSNYDVELFISMKPDPSKPDEVTVTASVNDCKGDYLVAAIVRAMHDNAFIRYAIEEAAQQYSQPGVQDILKQWGS